MPDGVSELEKLLSQPAPLPELAPSKIEYEVLSYELVNGLIKVEMEGQSWTYSLRTKAFTRRRPGKLRPVPGSVSKMEAGPEQVDRYSSRADLINRIGHCTGLIKALDEGIFDALLEFNVRKAA